ncbi:hypothetical protein P3T73_09545 [Kiritimatiellota bacterium B12222]|nr:hypothetical protein P3T73_09545 [Kiritimatiellota bacterium B12222]
MNTREIENALLLRDSGELSAEECKALDLALAADPAMQTLAEENQVLQAAGSFSSAEIVPPLSELSRERILACAQISKPRVLPRLLALAALLILGLSLLPHLSSFLQPQNIILTAEVVPLRPALDLQDPILDELDLMESELTLWTMIDVEDNAFLENENDWAETLIALEDTI